VKRTLGRVHVVLQAERSGHLPRSPVDGAPGPALMVGYGYREQYYGRLWVHAQGLPHTAAALSQVYLTWLLDGTLAALLVATPRGHAGTFARL